MKAPFRICALIPALVLALMAASCAKTEPSGYVRFGEKGFGEVRGGRVVFRTQEGSWRELSSRTFEIPKGVDRVFTFGFEGLGLVKDGEASFFLWDEGWKELEGSRMALPSGWDDISGMGGESLAVKSGREIRIWWFSAGAWKEIPQAGIELAQDKDDMFSFGFESLAFRSGSLVDLLSWNAAAKGWESHAGTTFSLPAGWSSCFEYGPDGLGVVVDGGIRFFRFNEGEWTEAPALGIER